jgi:SOS-response transcriptional repressor LexA
MTNGLLTRLERDAREARLLAAIRAYWTNNRCSPTVQELRRAAGISSSSVVAAGLRRLEGKGLIRLRERSARGIDLVLADGDPCPLCGCQARS